MSPKLRSSMGRVILILTILVLAACSPKTPDVQPQAGNTTAPRTPKPTFTPQPTQATGPTLAPTITPAPKDGATSAPTQGKPTEGKPTEAAKPTEQAPTPQPTARPPKGQRMESPEYGMQAFLWWRPEVASRDLQAIDKAGFGWVKVNFGWRDIEGAGKGKFDWSRTDWIVNTVADVGLDLVVRIDHQPQWTGGGFPVNGPPDNHKDLADFLTALCTRYKGKIRAIEIWNEPNLAREWGGKLPDPGVYVKLLNTSYKAIKATDPSVIVMSAGLSPTGTWNEESRPDDWYLKSMYIAMGNQSDGYFDVLAAHAPGFNYPPEADPGEVAAKEQHGQRAFSFRHVEDLRQIMVENGDQNKQIAVLEFGWTSDPRPDSPYHWHAVTEQQKADYLVRAYQYAKQNWAPWIGLMSLIYIADPDWKPEQEQYWWAITEPGWPELKARPAYDALKAMPK